MPLCEPILHESAVLQVISLEGWVDIMYYIQDVHSYWVWVYFLALIVVSKMALLISGLA